MSGFKTCTRCKIDKVTSEDQTVSCFRIRKEKNPKTGHVSVYFNNHCKQCECAKQKLNYEKNKDKTEFKEQNNKRAKKYAKKNEAIIKAKNKEIRASEKYKEYRANYLEVYQKEPKAIQLHSIRNKKYRTKVKENLTDEYVKRVIRTENYQREKRKAPIKLTLVKEDIQKKKQSILIFRLKNILKKLD